MWFRLYTDILNDPKVQRLKPEDFKHWINLLCIAKEGDGLLPSIEDTAFRLRITEADAQRLIEELVKRGLIDQTEGGLLEPHNWDSRQFISDEDPTAAIRARRYRTNKSSVTDASRVTIQTDNGPQSRDRAETETESEQSREVVASPAKRGSARRPQICDDDYLSELQANPAYAMLDVRRLYHKMVEWCRLKGKQPTRGRLVNWLNREDPPMTANGKPPTKASVGASPPPAPLSEAFMAEAVDDLIELADLIGLGEMYDAIIQRGGPKYEWEIRCVTWYELHKNEPITTEVL